MWKFSLGPRRLDRGTAMKSSRGNGAHRGSGERIRTARGRTAGQARWIERQLSDPYVARARAEGHRSRAIYKLMEIDERFKLFRAGQMVVDLGAAPGGWSEWAAQRTGAADGRGRVVAIDILDMASLPGVDFTMIDFSDAKAPALIQSKLGGPADIVMSDMAPNTIGHRQTDHLRIMALAEEAAAFAIDVLRPGGTFLTKVFQGGAAPALLADLKRAFRQVRHVKPPASRSESAELFLLATGFRGSPAADA